MTDTKTATNSRKSDVRVDRKAGDAGVIYGISIMEKGKLIDSRPWEIDETTLKQTVNAINSRSLGQKGRFTHPDLCHDGLGTEVARFKDARLSDDGSRVLADAYMLESGRSTPNGNLTDWLLSMADEAPDLLEISIAPDASFKLETRKDGEGKPLKDEKGNKLPDLYRFDGLRGVDFVDKGAANRRGLFGDSDVGLSATAALAIDNVLALHPKLKAVSAFGEPELLQLGLELDLPALKLTAASLSSTDDGLVKAARFLNSYLDNRSIGHSPITPELLASVMTQLRVTAPTSPFKDETMEPNKNGTADAGAGGGTATADKPPVNPAGAAGLGAGAEKPAIDAKAILKLAADKRAVLAGFGDFDLSALKPEDLINDPELSLDGFKAKILDGTIKSPSNVSPTVSVHVGSTGMDRVTEDMQLGIGYKLGAYNEDHPDSTIAAESKDALAKIDKNGLRSFSIQRFGMEFLAQGGVKNVHRLTADEQFNALYGGVGPGNLSTFGGITPGQFAILMESTVRRAIISKARMVQTTFDRLASIGDLKDFRTENRVMLSGLGEMKQSGDLDAPEGMTFAVRSEAISLATFKRAMGFTRRAYVNDDLQSIARMISQMTGIAPRTIENEFWRLILSNAGVGPTLSDGAALFHTSHANLAAGGGDNNGVPSQERLENMLIAMFNQMDFGEDNTDASPLGIIPKFLVAGLKTGNALEKIVGQLYLDFQAGKKQLRDVAQLEVVKVPYMSVNAPLPWFSVADPADWPGMEVAYLNGKKDPTVSSKVDLFEFNGQQFMLMHDFGIAYTGYFEAWRRNPGA